MKFTLQLAIDNELGQTQIEKIFEINKENQPSHCLGLSLLESKKILKNMQEKMLLAQIENHLELQKICSCCQHQRRIKGYETFQYRTLFGTVVLPNLRLYHCHCNETKEKTYSVLEDWLHEHNSPELQYIEMKWASYLSYQKASELLQDLLPIHLTHNAMTVRNHLHKMVKRQETELEEKPLCVSGCENTWAELPKPDKPLIVGSDGGYVRSYHDKNKNFEVIVGKVYSETKLAKRFGLVQSIDKKPQRRLLDVLRKQGFQDNQQVTFLSDGAENVRDLQIITMAPEAEHVLDWFHLTMRFTVLKQFTQGLIKTDPKIGKEIEDKLTSAKWYLWHGNAGEALNLLEDCSDIFTADGLDECEKINYKHKKKMSKQLEELTTYIENNQHIIPNYGDRYHYGEPITTSFVESTVNEVVTKRMVKKQQMQWTPKGAHYLIQARTAALNGDLAENFERWYPGLKINEKAKNAQQWLEKAV